MKKIPTTLQIDKYTDDDWMPVCGPDCVLATSKHETGPHYCHCRFWEFSGPGPDCPVWRKQDTGAGAGNLCTWWRCAGLDKDPDAEDDQP